MYVIIAYDCSETRTRVPREFLRRYLTHVQDSVFEGEVTEGQYKEIFEKLKDHHRTGESILFFTTREDIYEREILGEDPKEEEKFV